MGVRIDLPPTFKLADHPNEPVKLPDLLLLPDRENHPHLAPGGVLIGIGVPPGLPDVVTRQFQAAYPLPPADRVIKLPVDGLRLRAAPFKPAAPLPPGATLTVRLIVSYFDSSAGGEALRTKTPHRIEASCSLTVPRPGADDPKKPASLTVEPMKLLLSDAGSPAPLTVYIKNAPSGARPTVSLREADKVPAEIRPFVEDLLRQGLRRASSADGQDIYQAQLTLKLEPDAEAVLQSHTENGPLSVALRTEITKGVYADHVLELESNRRQFPGWMAMDLGTSNSTVTVYEPKKVVEPDGLAREQEARLRELLARWASSPTGSLAGVTEDRWRKFLEQVASKIGGGDRTGDPAAPGHARVLAALGCDAGGKPVSESAKPYEVVRWLEICLSLHTEDKHLRREAVKHLQAIYHEAFRVPPLESKCYYPFVLDIDRNLVELPSELEITGLGKPLKVKMGVEAHENRLKAVAEAKTPLELDTIKERFHHSPKRLLGRGKRLPVHLVGEGGLLVEADHLAQAAWKHMRDLSDDYRKRNAEVFSKGRFRKAIVTYPTVAPPTVRRKLESLVRELDFTAVQTDYDEAVAAAIFYLYREFGGSLDLGLEAFKARCRREADKWSMNCLVLDIGGGTTDVALLRLTLEDKTPPAVAARGGSARYYVITPELRGSSGHLELGGELGTLGMFRLLKAAIAENVLALAQEKKLVSEDLENVRLRRLPEPFVVKGEFKQGTILAGVQPGEGDRGPQWVAALGAAEAVLPTRWEKTPGRLLTFYPLWEKAEEAKMYFGKAFDPDVSVPPWTMPGEEVAALLSKAGVKFDLRDRGLLGVSLTRQQFRSALEPVVKEAVGLAQALLKSKLEPANEQLDWLILSGGTCNLNLVHQHIRTEFINSKNFVWNPERVTFEPKFAKLATSVGACYAEQLRQLRFAPEEWEGTYNSLYFNVRNLFYFLPCGFWLARVEGMKPLFAPNTRLHQLDAEPLGKARSEVSGVQLSMFVYRKDFETDSGKLWGKFNGEQFLARLNKAAAAGGAEPAPLSEFQFAEEFKVEFEVDHKLDLKVMVWRGRPRHAIEKNVPSLDLSAALAGFVPEAAKAPASPNARRPAGGAPKPGAEPGLPGWEIAANVEAAVNVAGAKGQHTPLFPAGPRAESAWRTFHLPDGSTRRGLVGAAAMFGFPEDGRLKVHARPHGSDTWHLMGELARPGGRTEYPPVYEFTLDELGVLRAHLGKVPYVLADSLEKVRDQEGYVWREALEVQEPDGDETSNPFNGTH